MEQDVITGGGGDSRKWEGDPHPPAAANKKEFKKKKHWFPILRSPSTCTVSNCDSHFSARTLLLTLNLPPPLNPVLLNILPAKLHFSGNRIHCLFLVIKNIYNLIFSTCRMK